MKPDTDLCTVKSTLDNTLQSPETLGQLIMEGTTELEKDQTPVLALLDVLAKKPTLVQGTQPQCQESEVHDVMTKLPEAQRGIASKICSIQNQTVSSTIFHITINLLVALMMVFLH